MKGVPFFLVGPSVLFALFNEGGPALTILCWAFAGLMIAVQMIVDCVYMSKRSGSRHYVNQPGFGQRIDRISDRFDELMEKNEGDLASRIDTMCRLARQFDRSGLCYRKRSADDWNSLMQPLAQVEELLRMFMGGNFDARPRLDKVIANATKCFQRKQDAYVALQTAEPARSERALPVQTVPKDLQSVLDELTALNGRISDEELKKALATVLKMTRDYAKHFMAPESASNFYSHLLELHGLLSKYCTLCELESELDILVDADALLHRIKADVTKCDIMVRTPLTAAVKRFLSELDEHHEYMAAHSRKDVLDMIR